MFLLYLIKLQVGKCFEKQKSADARNLKLKLENEGNMRNNLWGQTGGRGGGAVGVDE